MLEDPKIWFTIAFCIFIFLAYRPMKNALLKYLDDEISQIRTNLLDAEELKKDAVRLVESLKLSLSNFEAESLSLIKTTQDQNNIMIEESKKELDLIISRKEEEFLQRMNQIKLDAKLEIRNILQQETHILTEKYITQNRKSFPGDVKIASNFIIDFS